jgi:hypothetical protein
MGKLIQITNKHYIIVDYSPIKQNDWCIYNTGEIIQYFVELNTDNLRKITHSTPTGGFSAMLEVGVRELSLSNVQEAIQSYSVEKMAINEYPFALGGIGNSENDKKEHWIKGFKAHENLVKDKLFTTSDLEKAMECVYNWMIPASGGLYVPKPRPESLEELKKRYIQSLIPTEWEVKEITPEGKITLT